MNSGGTLVPVHDWKIVDDGIFHAFHTLWIAEINASLNDGLLPRGYYALPEQHVGNSIADVLTLHATPGNLPLPLPLPPDTGGVAVAEAAPRVRRRQSVEPATLHARQRSLAIRHVSGHRLIALLEIVSPANKDRAIHLQTFASKAVDALDLGVHLLLIDLFPPGAHDPCGVHGAVSQRLEGADEPSYEWPADEPLTLASYAAGKSVEIYLEHLAVGGVLVDMPLFLRPDRYVNVPLQKTYSGAFQRMPEYWRSILEGRPQLP
jgi:hypothetical protein